MARYQDIDTEVERLFAEMTVEERVGQVFLVTFSGDTLGAENEVAELIANYRVGGVVLLPEKDNLTGYGEPENTPAQLAQLARDLQVLALLGETPASQAEEPAESGLPTPLPSPSPSPVGLRLPLFIALAHEGQPEDGQRIYGGLTALPNNMAIGATWKPDYAFEIGRIVGQELEATGVNMLLGPTLDVLESPAPFNPADLGTTTFGGDPYWVGILGQSYSAGVHAGSQNRVAVIAKSFPGTGSSDRPTDEEVPTVRKSLEQLKQIELAPFVAVTGTAPDASSSVDGMLTTHIRYQGFQGNIRATTAPVSFDPQALNSLMSMPEFNTWRTGGGLLVSDALGVRSVERFYDDTEQEFPHRRVAKDALLAGNDLLYLGDFALGPSTTEQQVANIKDTIVWFREKYEDDLSFRQRIDEAVKRILRRKLIIYEGDWSPDNVLADLESVADSVGQGSPTAFDLAQASTTLISPSLSELAERMASPPGFGDSIVIFTDVREVQQCSYCPEDAVIGESAIADRLVALYGPEGSNQIRANQVTSFTFTDLEEFLDAEGTTIVLPTPEPTPTDDPDATAGPATPVLTPTPLAGYLVQEALRDADWIVFALLEGSRRSDALTRFLSERPDIQRDSRVMVFAFEAPYYLDTTEISKLTAYYGLYSSTDMFVDTAVRTLFMEAPLLGKSPVTISGIGYDLFTVTQPDPQQIIELYIVSDGEIQSPPSQEPLDAAIGDTLQLQTGVIVDRNGNQVPDGTIVHFIQQDRIQGTVSIIAEEPTTAGVARLGYVLEVSTGPGQFRITTTSGEATISQAVDISIEEEAEVIIVVPTLAPTATFTPMPTATNTPFPTPTATISPTETPVPPPEPQEPGIRIGLSELEMVLSMLTGLLIFTVVALFAGRGNVDPIRRAGALLWGLVGGLLLYIYMILQLPGTEWVINLGSWAGLTASLLGAGIGWALYQLVNNSQPQRS